jgi:NYN domain
MELDPMGVSGGLMMSQARSHVRTALFVDFDNMYLNLKAIDPAAGEAFATEPNRWLRWMREDMGHVVPDATEETSREILIRACYLNPVSFGRFRAYFTQSAFRVVDCPSLTSRGKNSADIYMVLDIVDTLAHSTHFDEFVLLSADADFTPVMLRLRAHDRRTVLLASGPSATALQSACDMVLPLDIFLSEALGFSLHQTGSRAGPVPSVPRVSSPKLPGQVGADRLQQAMHDELKSVMAAAEAPVPMAAAAQRIRARLGNEVVSSGWGGTGSFKNFVESVTGDGLQVSGPHPPGYLLDPRRHDPIEAQEPRVPLPDSVAGLAHRVARIVGVPQLTPEAYRILFEEIARLSTGDSVGEPLNAIEPTIRDACAARGARVTRAAIHFVLQGLQAAGADWRAAGRDASTLAGEFADNVIRLSLNARMELTGEETDELRAWIGGGEPSLTPTSAEPAGGSVINDPAERGAG